MATREQGTQPRTSGKRRAWGSLSRDEIVAVARRYTERNGLQQLSLTKLAKQLQASPTSVYWYFPSKDDLVAVLVDEVTEEMYLRLPPIGDGPWEEEIIEHHLAFRRLLQRTPIYRDVFAYRAQSLFLQSRLAPSILRTIEDSLALFVRGGLTLEQAAYTFNAFAAFTRAFVLMEQGIMHEGMDEDAINMLSGAMARIAPDASIIGSIEDLTVCSRVDDSSYLLGLRLLVDGVHKRYLTSPPKAPAKRRAASTTRGARAPRR